jgi:hypothetical protein
MSFVDDKVSFDKTQGNSGGNTTGDKIARAAIAAGILNQALAAKKENDKEKDKGVREQVDPDADHSVPVVYGTAFVKGAVTDAFMEPSGEIMWYCLTLCEKTGNLLSTGQPSVITIEKVYWNTNEIIFQSNGVTAEKLRSENTEPIVEDTKINGKVQVFLYNNGSTSQTFPLGRGGSTAPAYQRFPEWTTNHMMTGLVFAIVRVLYDKEAEITGIGNMEFKVRNTMTGAGDVLFDYMRNSRYGAGIPDEEIKRT